ncbi:MAG: Ppx/GppA family phosphatase [Firmicutes bacterium]|nr:Ppx/GppA family phosphatase [Bacillota bacterium]
MTRLGIIDLGSNSVRLIIMHVDGTNAHHQIENIKETVRLSSGLDEDGRLNTEAFQYAADTINLFVRFCQARNVDRILAVATAAVRNAPNGQELINYIYEKTGVKIQVLTGDEEAYLGYIGLVNSSPITTGLMADFGGGSLKLCSFENRVHQATKVFEFGVVTMAERFHLKDRPDPSDLQAMEEFLEQKFEGVKSMNGHRLLIGIGGTFRSLARIYRRRRHYLPDITDGIEIPAEEVRAIYEMLSRMSHAERLEVPGLEPARADLIVAGTGMIVKLMEAVGAEKVAVSTASIRDGIFYKYLLPRDPILFNVLSHHMENLIRYHGLDENHLRRVSNLAVTLFDQLQPIHKMGSSARRLLLIAGLLHEIGQVISVESLEKHTLYMLLHTPFIGLTQRERVMTAFLAACHDEVYLPDFDDYVERGPLLPGDKEIIVKLSPLLQITHSLDRSHTGVVMQVLAEIKDGVCEISVVSKANAELEIKDARRRTKGFKEIYGYDLVIKPQ